ncbi:MULTISPECIES: hypothetical protein [Sphingobium]|uniref:hypothetical protein n=1 Tax=Sphingobium sp. MI1205 TaxID=407020 RepID=UPI00076FF2F2|nr:hypothetical protein [Sphingobium sp. MI1205]AMK19939.1 hypothetical protein K663_17891 [Sphingobium sp. MI1205]
MSDEKASERAIEAAYRDYIVRYPAALWKWLQDGQPIDYDALGFWTFPMLFIAGTEGAGGEATYAGIQTLAEYDAGVRGIYRRFYDMGWRGRIELDRGDASLIGSVMGMIETRGTRYLDDGSILNHWDAVYMYRLVDGAWKQFAVADVEKGRPSADQWRAWLGSLAPAAG